MNEKFVYQVGSNKQIILWCTANQISSIFWSQLHLGFYLFVLNYW